MHALERPSTIYARFRGPIFLLNSIPFNFRSFSPPFLRFSGRPYAHHPTPWYAVLPYDKVWLPLTTHNALRYPGSNVGLGPARPPKRTGNDQDVERVVR